MVLCLGAHRNFSFSVLVIHTGLFTGLKLMNLFNERSPEVIVMMRVIADFYLQLIVHKILY